MLMIVSEGAPLCLYPLPPVRAINISVLERMSFNCLILFVCYFIQWHDNVSPWNWSVSFSALQRERTNRLYIWMWVWVCVCEWVGKRFIYFKELAREIVETGKSEIHKTGQQARNSGKISMVPSWGRFPSADWMRPTNMTKGNLHFRSADCKC